MVKDIFINLAVKDLQKSIEFFTKLGFTFNPEYTDDKGTCMILGENIYAMLLQENYFQTFIKKPVSDSSKTAQVILAFSINSRAEVDDMAKKAVAAGGSTPTPPSDYGWMYSQIFEDLDGHIWEACYGDEEARKKQAA